MFITCSVDQITCTEPQWVVRQKHSRQGINCIYFGHKTTVELPDKQLNVGQGIWLMTSTAAALAPTSQTFPFLLLFSFGTVKSRFRLTCIRSQLLSVSLKIPQSLKSFFSSAKSDTWADTSFSLKIPQALIPLLARLAHQLSSWNCSDITLLPFSLRVYVQRKCLSRQMCHQSSADSIGKNWACNAPTYWATHISHAYNCKSIISSMIHT